MPHKAEVGEAQNLADSNGEGNKNYSARRRAKKVPDGVDNGPAAVVNLTYNDTDGIKEPEYYIYDRYAKLIKM